MNFVFWVWLVNAFNALNLYNTTLTWLVTTIIGFSPYMHACISHLHFELLISVAHHLLKFSTRIQEAKHVIELNMTGS